MVGLDSLDKPWDARPALVDTLVSQLPPTPVSTTPAENGKVNGSVTPKYTSLPDNLVKALPRTPPQGGVHDYDEVHAWWWIVYEDVLSELKSLGEESGWREVDEHVKR